MKPLSLALSFLIYLFILAFSPVAFADSTISFFSNSGQATILVKNGRLLIRPNDPSNTANIQNATFSEAIFDTKNETLYLIDHEQQSISPITSETVEQLSSTINAAVGVLDSLSEENRDSLSGFMQGLGINIPEQQEATTMELVQLSPQEFRGITCNENKVVTQDSEGSNELGRICITQGNSTPMSNEDYQTLLSAQTFFLSMAEHAAVFAEQYGQLVSNLGDIEINGLLVNSEPSTVDENIQNARFTVSSIDTQPLADIDIPSNYQTKKLLP